VSAASSAAERCGPSALAGTSGWMRAWNKH
jgi:hypothetical protein